MNHVITKPKITEDLLNNSGTSFTAKQGSQIYKRERKARGKERGKEGEMKEERESCVCEVMKN